jgi:hypothetical protein
MIKVKKEEILQTKETATAIVCDKCKKEVSIEEDPMEAQEFYRIYFTGGYSSIFGDMTTVECDLCQNCLMEFIKPYYRTSEDQLE